MPDPHEVPARIRDLAAQLVQPKAMRRGSFSQRYVKCSKSGCPCASDPKARHGPYAEQYPYGVSAPNASTNPTISIMNPRSRISKQYATPCSAPNLAKSARSEEQQYFQVYSQPE